MYRYYVLWYGTGTVMMISWNETERSAHILLCIRVAHEGKHVGLVQCTDTTHENMLSMLNYPYCIKLNNIYVCDTMQVYLTFVKGLKDIELET